MYGHDVSRTNYNPDETIIGSGNLNQLVSRWQVNIGSNGTAPAGAPSVANGKIYVGSSAPSGNNFFAFDAVSGAQAWATSVSYQSSCFNVGIGSTSAISGTTLVVGGGDPAYYGLDANTGAQLWRHPMNVGSSGFPWESPLIRNNQAYIGIASRCDNPSVRGEIRGLAVASGTQLANQYFVGPGQAGAGIWNSPALSPDGGTLAVVTGEDYSCSPCTYTRAMVTLDPDTLAILQYNQQGNTNQDADFGTTPVIFHDSQSRTLVGANHKNGVFYAYVLNNVSGGPLWSRSTGTSVGMMPAYDPSYGSGGTLFIFGSGSRLYAVDPATGTDRWPSVTTGSAHGNMAIANGLIFLNMGSGLQIRDETNGSLLRTLTPANSGAANSGLAVSNGFIYWLSGSYINAWSLPPGVTPTVPPTIPPTFTPQPSATSTPPAPTSTSTATNTPAIATNTPPPGLTATPTIIQPTSTQPVPTTTSPVPTSTPIQPTDTPANNTPTATQTVVPEATTPIQPTAVPSSTSTPCVITFTDVPTTNPFYTYIRCLACRGIISGYSSGCESGNPCFRPANNVTRGQTAKIVSNAAGYSEIIPPGQQSFEDVAPGSTFWVWIERVRLHGVISGYDCGASPAGPCNPPLNRPYFLPYNDVTRGQLAKIVSGAAEYSEPIPSGQQTFHDVPNTNPFWVYIERVSLHGVISGYDCGAPPAGPCDPLGRPYFLTFNTATRGQTAKIVGNAFFRGCQTPACVDRDE